MQLRPLLIYCAAGTLLELWAGLLKKFAAIGRLA